MDYEMPWTRVPLKRLEQAERHNVVLLRCESECRRELAEIAACLETQLVPRPVADGQLDVSASRQRSRGRDIQPRGIAAHAVPTGAVERRLLRIRVGDLEPDAREPTDSSGRERIESRQGASRQN